MRHGICKKKLNMSCSRRTALIVNLMISLLKNGKIETTFAKAKVLQKNIAPIITKVKSLSESDISSLRDVVSDLNHGIEVKDLLELGAKFANRSGGYTRVVKNGNRYGDCAKTAIIEFVS